MCLFNDPAYAKKLHKKMVQGGKPMKCWKIVSLAGSGASIVSFYRSDYRWKQGVNWDSRRTRGLRKSDQTISEGIHVYTSEATVKRYYRDLNQRINIILPVYCEPEDLRGADPENDTAVFAKVTVTPQAFTAAKKKSQEICKKP